MNKWNRVALIVAIVLILAMTMLGSALQRSQAAEKPPGMTVYETRVIEQLRRIANALEAGNRIAQRR